MRFSVFCSDYLINYLVFHLFVLHELLVDGQTAFEQTLLNRTKSQTAVYRNVLLSLPEVYLLALSQFQHILLAVATIFWIQIQTSLNEVLLLCLRHIIRIVLTALEIVAITLPTAPPYFAAL